MNDVQQPKITVFPNPASDEIKITIPKDRTLVSIALFDVLGKKIPLDISEELIDVSHLLSGIYLLRMETDRGISTQKLVKL